MKGRASKRASALYQQLEKAAEVREKEREQQEEAAADPAAPAASKPLNGDPVAKREPAPAPAPAPAADASVAPSAAVKATDEAPKDDGVLVDPNDILVEGYNRAPGSFDRNLDSSFDQLAVSIEQHGRNVQPIGIRPLPSPISGKHYSLIYGERRMQACLQLGLQVYATRHDVSAGEAYSRRLSENLGRKDHSNWEFIRLVTALAEEARMDVDEDTTHNIPWLKRLAREVDRQYQYVSKLIRIGKVLPQDLENHHPDIRRVPFRALDKMSASESESPGILIERAKAFAKLPDAKQKDVNHYLINGHLPGAPSAKGRKGTVKLSVSTDALQASFQVEDPAIRDKLKDRILKAASDLGVTLV